MITFLGKDNHEVTNFLNTVFSLFMIFHILVGVFFLLKNVMFAHLSRIIVLYYCTSFVSLNMLYVHVCPQQTFFM